MFGFSTAVARGIGRIGRTQDGPRARRTGTDAENVSTRRWRRGEGGARQLAHFLARGWSARSQQGQRVWAERLSKRGVVTHTAGDTVSHRMCCGALAGCAISCCSACACNVCCRLGNARSVGVKLLYAFLLLFTSLIALCMLGTSVQRWLSEQLSGFWFTGTAEDELVGDDLVGTLAVTRIMSATVVFHLVFAVLVCGVQNSKGARARLHNGFWPVKMMFLLALMVLMFFLPNALFVGLSATLYRVGGGLYILIQLILFLGWVVSFYHHVFVEYIQKGDGRGWACVVIAVTLIAYAWVLFVVVATVVIHASGDGCAEGLAGSFVGLLACVVVSVLSISGCASVFFAIAPVAWLR